MFHRLIVIALANPGCTPLPEAVPIEAACSVTDGDTIRCGDERVRLLAIDAPEMPGSCRPGRDCVAGDPFASTESLRQAMAAGPLSIRRFGSDRYGRTLALVAAGNLDLSCYQIAKGHAQYVARWDNQRAVARTCPDMVRN